jgi:hypothetical protein
MAKMLDGDDQLQVLLAAGADQRAIINFIYAVLDLFCPAVLYNSGRRTYKRADISCPGFMVRGVSPWRVHWAQERVDKHLVRPRGCEQ